MPGLQLKLCKVEASIKIRRTKEDILLAFKNLLSLGDLLASVEFVHGGDYAFG
jgi:hypothetical protein